MRDRIFITATTDAWRLTILKTQVEPLVNKNKTVEGKQQDQWIQSSSIEDYDDHVYCCTVPEGEGIIYVRRGGKPIWCGQSRGGCTSR